MKNFKAIGVLSLPDDLGKRSFEDYISSLLLDFFSLQDGGIDLILIENEGDKAASRRANPQTIDLLSEFLGVMDKAKACVRIPYLIGVLPADYEASFDLAKRFNALGVWMDTLVDRVSPKYIDEKIVIDINPEDVLKYKGKKKLYVEVQPRNFYEILDRKRLEESVGIARKYADAICVVGENSPPSLALLRRSREVVGENYPIGVSGKLSTGNIQSYVGIADFGVFFSSLRGNGDYNKPIDEERVRLLIERIK